MAYGQWTDHSTLCHQPSAINHFAVLSSKPTQCVRFSIFRVSALRSSCSSSSRTLSARFASPPIPAMNETTSGRFELSYSAAHASAYNDPPLLTLPRPMLVSTTPTTLNLLNTLRDPIGRVRPVRPQPHHADLRAALTHVANRVARPSPRGRPAGRRRRPRRRS